MNEKIVICWKPCYPPSYLKGLKAGDIHFYGIEDKILMEPHKWIYYEKGFKCFDNIYKAREWNGENFENYINFYFAEIDDIVSENEKYIIAKKIKINSIEKEISYIKMIGEMLLKGVN